MGNSQSGRLTKDELEELHKRTHFEQKELKEMYKQFKKETPQGVINKKEFKEVMKAMGVWDIFLQDLIFNVFDSNKDGSINFQEFVTALSIMKRGTSDEKLEFAFQMYDFDGTKCITKESMTTIMEAFYKLVGPLVTYSGKKFENPEDLVEEFFEEMDNNHDGKISLEEYKEGAMKNTDIIQGLKLFSKEEEPER
eukprot:TRINITY_DN13340_c0_g1_i1.p1 TRINITY_DN13340_c0_g1~~TRINITY_DN13340_c0_g1_i1.p1  ORF type:complete len:195 (-),score=49.02 TRINITY_DN13340_c0_g1_i1:98-682(-)